MDALHLKNGIVRHAPSARPSQIVNRRGSTLAAAIITLPPTINVEPAHNAITPVSSLQPPQYAIRNNPPLSLCDMFSLRPAPHPQASTASTLTIPTSDTMWRLPGRKERLRSRGRAVHLGKGDEVLPRGFQDREAQA